MGEWTRRSALGGSLGALGAALGGGAWAESAGPVDMWLSAVGNLFVGAKLDGKPATMLIDPGNPASLLDVAFATAQGLASDKDVGPTGAPTRLKKPIRFDVGPVNRAVSPQLTDFSTYPPERGQVVSALVGGDVLNETRLVLDFDNERLTATPKNKRFDPPLGALPLRRAKEDKRRYWIDIRIEDVGPIQTLVGLNNYAPLLVTDGPITDNWFKSGRPWSDTLALRQSATSSAQLKNIVTMVDHVDIGPFRVNNVPVEIIRTPQGQMPGSTTAIIGPPLLARFLVVMDGVADRLMLAQGRDIGRPFHKQTTGIGAKFEGDRLRVMHVGANSPAVAAGVALNQVIVAVDGAAPSRDALRNVKAGDQVELKFDDGSTRSFEAREYY